ncbi:MAG: glycosyltransferase family 4 protein [Firmicutes bacterium]|nr:glycosyltransferase family 4 protein [Bacillota bacterium]
MKILHLTRPAAGGMREYIMTLLEALAKWDYQLYLAGPVEGWDRSRLQGVEFFPLEIGSSVQWGELRLVWRLSSFMRRAGIELCHAHGYRAGLLARLAGAMAGVRVIVTFHNFLPQGWQRTVYRGLERVMEPWPVARVAVCEAIRHHYARAMGLSAEPIKVIPPGLDWSTRLPPQGSRLAIRSEVGVGPSDLFLITLARLIPAKGVQYLLQAMSLLGRSLPSLKLVVCGDGPFKGILQELADKLGLSSRVIFTGFRADALSLLQAADIFVLPSLSEGMPLSVLEAMALGKPVIATRVGGIPEVIEHGKTGWLVPPGNAGALAATLQRAVRSSPDYLLMARRARGTILRRFSIDETVISWRRLYEGLPIVGEVVPLERS